MESRLWGGMAEIVGGLGASCIHTARDGYQNTKRVQMNSLRAFGGGLTQGNDGKSAMGGYGWECRQPCVSVYMYG